MPDWAIERDRANAGKCWRNKRQLVRGFCCCGALPATAGVRANWRLPSCNSEVRGVQTTETCLARPQTQVNIAVK